MLAWVSYVDGLCDIFLGLQRDQTIRQSCVIDDDVDLPQVGKGVIHDLSDGRRIAHVQRRHPKAIAIFRLQVIQDMDFAEYRCYSITALQKSFGHKSADA